ncbi:PIN domain-containing protein [Variovorax robiniae]|uniref:PIN domain-containing protein n=1 Tax=Variovorax robiniae TaxID=1836199 RepID=A0ABU8XBR9_9BURK
MAGSAFYTAVIDANALFPRLQCDVLLSLADADLYSAKWSATIMEEWTAAFVRQYPGTEAAVKRKADAMCSAIPDCLVEGYEPLIDGLKLPDARDRHVLAAAIAGHADAIVTWNGKHFPPEALAPHGIEIQTPDEFVTNQIMLNKLRSVAALRAMRERWARPALTGQNLIDLLNQRHMPLTAAHLQDAVDLL